MKNYVELVDEFSRWIAESADKCCAVVFRDGKWIAESADKSCAVVLYDESWISYEMHSRELFRQWALTTRLPRGLWDDVFKLYMGQYMKGDE